MKQALSAVPQPALPRLYYILTHSHRSVLMPEELALLLSSPTPPQTCLSMIGSLISNSSMAIDSKTHMVGAGSYCVRYAKGLMACWPSRPVLSSRCQLRLLLPGPQPPADHINVVCTHAGRERAAAAGRV